MPHLHSYHKRKERLLRARARGFLQPPTLPIGATSHASLISVLPSFLQQHCAKQFQVAQLAIAAHTLIAATGVSALHLGGDYQQLRGVLPNAMVGGLRRLNRAYNSVRHAPLVPARLPVGLGLLRQIQRQLCTTLPAPSTCSSAPAITVLSSLAAPFTPWRDHRLLLAKCWANRQWYTSQRAGLHTILFAWRLSAQQSAPVCDPAVALVLPPVIPGVCVVAPVPAGRGDVFYDCESDDGTADCVAYDPWDAIAMDELHEPVPLQRLRVIDIRPFLSPKVDNMQNALTDKPHFDVMPRVMLGPFRPHSIELVIKGFPDFWTPVAISKWLSACLGCNWKSQFHVVRTRFPMLEGKVVLTFNNAEECQSFFTHQWTNLPALPVRTEAQAKRCGLPYSGVATLHMRMKQPEPSAPISDESSAPEDDLLSL